MSWKEPPPNVAFGSREAFWSHLTGRNEGEIRWLLEFSERFATPELIGVGYALKPTEQGPVEWRPLILFDADLLGVRPQASLLDGLDRAEVPLPPGVVADLPDAYFVPTRRPELLSSPAPGDLVTPEELWRVSSVGVRAVRELAPGEWQPGFLTTGHGFPGGIGSPVFSVPRGRVKRVVGRWLGERRRIGELSLRRSPVAPGATSDLRDYDYAFVDLDLVDEAEWPLDAFCIPTSQLSSYDFDRSRKATVVGGVSGRFERATVIGALMDYEHWKDCWLLAPASGFAPGDSGSVVTLNETGKTLGLVVGRTVWDDTPHQFFVQSLERVMAEGLGDLGVRLEWT